VDFRDPAQHHLAIEVDRDRLLSRPAGSSTAALVESGSVLYLGPPATPGAPASTATYKITITAVNPHHPFWASCPGCTNTEFPVYDFTATNLADGCDVEFCQPGLSQDSEGQVKNLSGSAVIFRGDFYDDAYTVRTTPPADYDDDVFNIACLGTAISKLHLFRHTSASRVQPSDPPPPVVAQRQALLRLLTADYCGIGHPFTVDGTPIRLGFNSSLAPTEPSLFALNATSSIDSIDALWTGDGATCIGTPRLEASAPGILGEIQTTCQAALHPLPACTNLPPFLPPFPMGSYAISQNP
jgi:hypothetical protein